MPATQVPSPVAADSTGLPDSSWINKVRDALEDYPRWLLEQWVATGVDGVNTFGGAPLSVQFPKINGDAATNTPILEDSTGSIAYTVVDFPTVPTGTQVQVNYDTGELIWATAPTSGHTIAYSYQTCKWRDQPILDALVDGLRAMFPAVGKTYTDISLPIQVNVWDYQLPAWFADPRSRIISLEIADPFIPSQPFKVAPPGEDRIGLGLLHLPWSQRYSPTARVRIVGWGPYLRLGDLEPQLYNLPIYYALGVLLPKRETKRIREDTVVPVAQLGAAQPSLHMQTGDYWTRRFDVALANLARLPGPTSRRPWASKYQRNRY